MKTLKDFKTVREFIQYCIDELNDLPASADSNKAYDRYARANSLLISLSAQEAKMEISMSDEDRKFLAFARSTASEVRNDRQRNRRFTANAGAPVQSGASRPLTEHEQESYNQVMRAIECMTTEDRSRQSTAKAVVNFGKGDGRNPGLSLKHPAKSALWAAYTKKADETTALECERLVKKLRSEPNPVHDEVVHLKYLVKQVMPGLAQLGANNNVDTSRSFNVLKASEKVANEIIDKHQKDIDAKRSEPSKDGKSA